MDDLELLKKAEEALAEIDRNDGLADEHAEVLAALRIRIFGAPKKTLDDALKAAGDIKGKFSLENPPPPKEKPSLEKAMEQPGKKLEWPGDPDTKKPEWPGEESAP